MTHPAGAPLALGGLTLRNRLVVTAHGLATVTDGVPTAQDAAYWTRLSAGGAALLIAGGTQVSPDSVLKNRILTEAYDRRAIPGLAERAAAMRSGGAVAGIQLGHLGRETLGAGTFLPFVAPSPVPGPREPAPARPLDVDEVARIAEDYRVSTAHCVEAGFEVVEIHAAHGYLLAQFLSRSANTRTDRYGGSPANRARALAEVVRAVRAGAGDRVVVGVRVSVEGDGPRHLRLEELAELLPLVQAEAPFDYLDLTWGDRGRYVPDMGTVRPPLLGRALLDSTAELRAELGVPLLLCAAFRRPTDIAEALESGAADLVGSARAHIADPDFARKVLDGRDAEIRPCVACLQDCRSYEPTGLCAVNPDLAPAGESRKPARPYRPARHVPSGPRVLVVGAGPAGLECAITAAARPGVEVVLLERSRRIGGQLCSASAAPHRSGWADLLAYYRRRLDALGVRVRLGAEPTEADLAAAEEIVWALGAQESVPTVEGAVTAETLLRDAGTLLTGARSVVVCDDGFGGWPGVGAVEAALASGVPRVVLTTPGSAFAGAIPAESRTQLLERLAGRPLDVRPLCAPVAWEGGVLRLRRVLDGTEETVPADLVVQVGTRYPRPVPHPDRPATRIGDAVAPRQVSHAIAEGRAAGLDIRAGARTAAAHGHCC
jgi:2,4-dienoyl-CoA reductase-like NADH-dependent reductase (Old Yellow Enzyme family)